MRLAEPVAASWKAHLALGFAAAPGRTVLAERRYDGPLVVQKPLYPEGPQVCQAIIVHPPGGIAGGDQLSLAVSCERDAHALLTTPGAGKWYRSAGAWASQSLEFHIDGTLEWLPRETIVFDGALAEFDASIALGGGGRYPGWEIVCLGRAGSGERYERGRLRLRTRIERDGRAIFREQGEVDAGGRLMRSSAGLGGHAVFGTFIATCDDAAGPARSAARELAITQLPGVLVARYLGDSSEEALGAFTALWMHLRPQMLGRAGVAPR